MSTEIKYAPWHAPKRVKLPNGLQIVSGWYEPACTTASGRLRKTDGSVRRMQQLARECN